MNTSERRVRWSKGTPGSLRSHLILCGLALLVGVVWSCFGPGVSTPLIALPLGMMILPPCQDLYEQQKTLCRYVLKTVSQLLYAVQAFIMNWIILPDQ